MTRDDAEKIYDSLFCDDKVKAEAFDKIAEKYYFSNFGSTSKADFDVLMFSIYIEQILQKSQGDFTSYSDYTLSKQLGITQAKVSNLKVRKELIYPYKDFDWKKSLVAISKNAIFEDEKIKLFIPDRNVFLEIKNAVETMGGFIEIQITSNLLQLRLPFFLDLITCIESSDKRSEIKRLILEKAQQKEPNIFFEEEVSFGQQLKDQIPEVIFAIIGECIPVFGGVAKIVAENLFSVVKRKFAK